jgi:crotonyl-CoA carboxylase/reductase
MLPHWKDTVGYGEWLKGVRHFGKAIWDILGEKRNPRIVFEHPGEDTIPTSIFVCDSGGMVVICAGTTGYNAVVDLRYLWMRQKRLQGSHFANDVQAKGINDLVLAGKVDPCNSRVFSFDELPLSHQLMFENRHPHGNMSVLVGAREQGMGLGVLRTKAPKIKVPRTPFEADDHYKAPQAQVDADSAFGETLSVRSVMHVGVTTCLPSTKLGDLARELVDLAIHAMVVVDDAGRAIGLVSQTDLVLARQGRSAKVFELMSAESVMTREVIWCSPMTSVTEAITLMTRHRVHRLIVQDVVGAQQIAVGVVSMSDIVRKVMG